MYVCMYNISPPFKNIINNKSGINVVLYLFCNLENNLKKFIYETYNIIFDILKFCTKY